MTGVIGPSWSCYEEQGEIGPVRHGVELAEPERREGETRSASTEEENEAGIRILVDREK